MAKLIKAVHVRDPERHRTVLLLPGEEPEPRLAALVTNPDAWEDGQVPAAPSEPDDMGKADTGDTESAKKAAPAAAKTAAKKTASSRSRGRAAAGEGTSGE